MPRDSCASEVELESLRAFLIMLSIDELRVSCTAQGTLRLLSGGLPRVDVEESVLRVSIYRHV